MDIGGDKSYREDVLNAAMEILEENTRSSAVVKACEHARRDKKEKINAICDLTRNVEPEIVAEVVDRLPTPQLNFSVQIHIVAESDSIIVDVEMDNEPTR